MSKEKRSHKGAAPSAAAPRNPVLARHVPGKVRRLPGSSVEMRERFMRRRVRMKCARLKHRKDRLIDFCVHRGIGGSVLSPKGVVGEDAA